METGIGCWVSHIVSLTGMGLLSLRQRGGAVMATVIGIAGVVLVLVAVLSLAVGFQRTMMASSSPEVAIVLRNGSDTEMVSGFERATARVVANAPGVAHRGKEPLASAELLVTLNLPKRSTGTDVNVPLRGVQPAAFQVRAHLRLLQGRRFTWGKNEVMVGSGAAKQFAGLRVGNKLRIGRYEWPIVGIFSTGGGIAESEIWTDAVMLQAAYQRGDSFQSVYARLQSPAAFGQFDRALRKDPRLLVKAMRQNDYYAEQSAALLKLIQTLGFLIGFVMALGAVFGALNTMYSTVAARSRELATLRALGFSRSVVVVSVLLESLALALGGGALGAGLAYFLFNGLQTGTLNWQSFSQVTFTCQVTAPLLLRGIAWAATIGLLGGVFPALRAARQPLATALRES